MPESAREDGNPQARAGPDSPGSVSRRGRSGGKDGHTRLFYQLFLYESVSLKVE
jgi:hypothetical protein